MYTKVCEVAYLNLKSEHNEECKVDVKHSISDIIKANILIRYKPEFLFIKRKITYIV